MYQTIDKSFLQVLRADIDAAMAAVATKHGILIKAGKGIYGGTTGAFTLELAVPSDSGATDPAVVRAEKDWANYAKSLFNLETEWLGKTVKHKREDHKIIGLMPNRSKFPVLVLTPAGKQMLLTVEGVQRALGVKAAAA